MGCHTWFYRKIERTQEEAKENCLNGLKEAKELNLNILKDRFYNGIDWSEWSEDTLRWDDAVLERKIRMVENNLCQKAVWNYQSDEDLTEFVEDKGLYIEDTGFHDVFRKYGYPDDKLFSLDETLEYLNNPKNECVFDENSIIRLKEFWKKFPNGMIEFG